VLVHDGLDSLRPHQVDLAHPAAAVAGWVKAGETQTLAEVIEHGGGTTLIGVTGQSGLFDRDVIDAMANNVDRPVIMPLSNPTRKAEATPSDVLHWTGGRAIVATGSPFDQVKINGETHTISQSNNVYVFPGPGLGAVAVGASTVSDAMLMAAAKAVSAGDIGPGVLPPLEDVPELSLQIAKAVGRQARDEGLTRPLTDGEIDDPVDSFVWHPIYANIVAE